MTNCIVYTNKKEHWHGKTRYYDLLIRFVLFIDIEITSLLARCKAVLYAEPLLFMSAKNESAYIIYIYYRLTFSWPFFQTISAMV